MNEETGLSSMSRTQLSSLAFGIAVLSKLNAVFAAPGILLLVWMRAHKKLRFQATWQWAGISLFVISLFILYAVLKGELLPSHIGSNGIAEHVSLLDTLKQQAARGDFAWPWETKSSFYLVMYDFKILNLYQHKN